MASEYETVADIVKEMLNLGLLDEKSTDKIPRSLQALGLRTYASRIEAAHQREVVQLKSKMNDVVCENEALRDACGTCGAKREREATREKSSQVGNAAAMRDACANIAEYARAAACHTENSHLLGYLYQIEEWAKAAISAPARNCDVGTTEEQHARFCSFCNKFDECNKCPLCSGSLLTSKCYSRWAQMPYEEGDEK